MALPWVCKPRSAKAKAKNVFISQFHVHKLIRDVSELYLDNA